MGHIIEPASSGRAKCRGCGQTIAKSELRFGERLPNPFGDGEATYWFHLMCGACKRPESFLTVDDVPEGVDNWAELQTLAKQGSEHRRVARIMRAERAPSGRARCRHCKEKIDKGAWRLALDFWEEGRFSPSGFIHLPCAAPYFEMAEDVMARVRHFTQGLSESDFEEIDAGLRGGGSA